MRSPEILHDEICQRLDKIISILTEECQRTRLSEAVIRENEVLTKENMTLQSSRDDWRRIATEAKAGVEGPLEARHG